MRLPFLVAALAAAAKEKEAAPPRVYRELHAHHGAASRSAAFL